jgi:hypothetical protein
MQSRRIARPKGLRLPTGALTGREVLQLFDEFRIVCAWRDRNRFYFSRAFC